MLLSLTHMGEAPAAPTSTVLLLLTDCAIFVSIDTIRISNSRPFRYRCSSIIRMRRPMSKMLAHSVAERFAIR